MKGGPLWGPAPQEKRKNRLKEYVALAEQVKITLYPWQKYVLRVISEHKPSGPYYYPRVYLSVPRRGGKTFLLQLRCVLEVLSGGFVLSAADKMNKAQALAGEPWAWAEDGLLGPDIVYKKGNAGFEMRDKKSGGRWRILATRESAFRGEKASLLCFDEAALLSLDLLRGAEPTMATFKRNQILLASNAGDYTSELWKSFYTQAQLVKGKNGWFQYSAPEDSEIGDRAAWKVANPTLGKKGGVTLEYLEQQYANFLALDRLDDFAREYLNLWPSEVKQEVILSLEELEACIARRDTRMGKRFMLSVDADEYRGEMAIVATEKRRNGKILIDNVGGVLEYHKGEKKLIELALRYKAPIVIDNKSPMRYVCNNLRRKGIKVNQANWNDVLDASVAFVEAVKSKKLLHLGQNELTDSVLNAVKRSEKDGRWAWSRQTDISATPLIAASLGVLGIDRWPFPSTFLPEVID